MTDTWQNIDHVVVLLQENLSFDRVFGWMGTEAPGGDGVPPGLSFTVDDPLFPPGTRLHPEPGAALIPPGASHMPWDMNEQLHTGPLGAGFLPTQLRRAHKSKKLDDPGRRLLVEEALRYHRRDDLPVYRDLVAAYAVADRWFAPIASATWPNRYFMHLGTSPTGDLPLPELTGAHPTIFDRLTEAGLSWRIYVDGPATLITSRSVMGAARRARAAAVRKGIRGEDADAVRSFDRFVCDVSRSATTGWPAPLATGPDGLPPGHAPLPTYTFIEPRHWPVDGRPANNDHHHTHMHDGQRLVASIYNTLRADPARWARTLFVVSYDEHGGYWDHVTPPPAPHPETGVLGVAPPGPALDWYGGRVPAILVSPWIRPEPYHTVCDHTSVLAFLERRFRLPALTRRDALADDLTGAFGPTARATPARIEPPPPPPPVPRTGDLDQDFTGMALDLYRELAKMEGVDGDAELRRLPPAAIAATGEARFGRVLESLNADAPTG